jgi:hypothetical protein
MTHSIDASLHFAALDAVASEAKELATAHVIELQEPVAIKLFEREDWSLGSTTVHAPEEERRSEDEITALPERVSMEWPLPPRSPLRDRRASTMSISKKFHPQSVASMKELVSTPSWPLPGPAPLIRFDERHGVSMQPSPPPSPITIAWPLPPTAHRASQPPQLSTSRARAFSEAAATNKAPLVDGPRFSNDLIASPVSATTDSQHEHSWDGSQSDGQMTGTPATSVDFNIHEEQEADVCVLSPEDWFAQFGAEDIASDDTVTDECPDRATLAAVQHIPVYDSNGMARPFGALYEPTHSTHQRQLIIFIRHFYCGGCQAYIKALAESITMSEYFHIPIPTKIMIIGCGQPSMINYYRNFTQCPFPIYAEPSRKLFKKLGMNVSVNLGMRPPEYMKGTGTVPWLANQVKNIHRGLRATTEPSLSVKDVFRGGNIMQIGGEFLFEDGQVLWCHRMKHYRNHAEVPVLRKLLDLDD